jgi:hypothetical protein
MAVLGIALALIAGCANNLLVDARDQQAKTQSPLIALSKADGSSLSSGGSYDFVPESVGGTLSAKLTIKNSGANDLSIGASGISITPSSGTGSGIFQIVGAQDLSIANGSSASFTISFTPTAAQSYSATLTITSNDVLQPSFSVKLTGLGSSTAKAMKSFGIQSPAATGVIDEAGKTISVALPNTSGGLTALVASFQSTGVKVMVGSAVQTSGTTANDFSSPVTYTVVAQDGSSANYVATVKVVPAVSTASASLVTATSATCGGNITDPGSAAVTDSGLCWSASQNPTIADSHVSSGLFSGSFSSLAITGLASGTTYYVRAYATNIVGTGYGSQASLTTLPGQSVIASITSVGGASGSDKLVVTWDAVAGATSYDVYADQSSTFPSTTATGGAGISGTSCTLSGLSVYKTYNVWVRAKNATGSGLQSAPSSGYVGKKVTGISLQRKADRVAVSGGRTKDDLVVTTAKADGSGGSHDILIATVSPSDATSTTLTWTPPSVCTVTSTSTDTFTVTIAATAAGSGNLVVAAADGQGASVPCALTITQYAAGAAFCGGYLVYDSGTYTSVDANGDWRYIAMMNPNVSGIPWAVPGYSGTVSAVLNSDGVGIGLPNTKAIMAAMGAYNPSATNYAAYYAWNYLSDASKGSYSDFALASHTELVCFFMEGLFSYSLYLSSSLYSSTGLYCARSDATYGQASITNGSISDTTYYIALSRRF